MNNLFVFDIETIPDIASGRRLHALNDLNDADVAKALFCLRRQETGTDFLRHHLQKIVAISVVLETKDKIKVWSLGEPGSGEAELITRFYAGLERYNPVLVSWNGGGFDLPVLHYRSLLHQISAPHYWETGDEEPSFRWNNYLSRYHYRHTDLMDVLSGYQARAAAPLDEIATVLGFPGKMGMSGKAVWERYEQGDIIDIRNYCETDVLNTYLVYLRYQIIRGKLTSTNYQVKCAQLREMLREENKPHLHAFLKNWPHEHHT